MLAFTRRGAFLIEILVLPNGTLDRSALLRVDVSTDLRVNDMKWLLFYTFSVVGHCSLAISVLA
jgi:hypothetical protein